MKGRDLRPAGTSDQIRQDVAIFESIRIYSQRGLFSPVRCDAQPTRWRSGN